MEDELLTVEELCVWLKVTRRTTERWRREGMPFIKIGRGIRFERQAVIKWIKENKQE